jgi:hypothetical protein
LPLPLHEIATEGGLGFPLAPEQGAQRKPAPAIPILDCAHLTGVPDRVHLDVTRFSHHADWKGGVLTPPFVRRLKLENVTFATGEPACAHLGPEGAVRIAFERARRSWVNGL